MMSAAALSRGDAGVIARLPVGAADIPNELVVQTSHQIHYDQAWLLPGARLATAGTDTGCTEAEFEVGVGLGRIVALYDRSSTSYQIQ
jgi:hypothetical protein